MNRTTLRVAALLSFSVAGVALTAAGYTWFTTTANAAAVKALEKRIEDHTTKAKAEANDALSTATAAGGDQLDERSAGPVDWSAVLPKVMPAVVNVSVILQAQGLAESNKLWTIPGVRENVATAVLTRYRAHQAKWSESDAKRDWKIRGAGFLVGDGLRVLTAAHVIEGIEKVRVKLAGGEWRAATVAGSDVAQDVGLLRIEGEPGQAITIAPAMPRQGQPVLAIGSPGGYGFSVGAGLVSRYGRDTYFATDEFMQIAGPIIGGNSGGVVVNAWGEAVGLVSYGLTNITQAIPIRRALAVATRFQEE